MSHQARKRFGQNFLQSDTIIQRIIDVIQPLATDLMVEIGPGLGAITQALLQHLPSMHAIEIDRDLISRLQKKFPKLQVHEGDALRYAYDQWGKHLRVVGNLPYNISTPLLFRLAEFAPNIRDMHFMLQKEVVDRMAAEPNCSDYGRLSVMLQYRFSITALFDVDPEAFHPPPKVMSAMVRLVPYATLPWPAEDEAFFARVVSQAFNQRRKTLKNTLAPLVSDPSWWTQHTEIDPSRRAESLSVQEFVALAHQLRKEVP